MEQLHINFQNELTLHDTMDKVSLYLDKEEKHLLNYVPWSAYPYKPEVQFSIVCNNDFIFLKYFVRENFIKAVNGTSNAPVYEDACVEFFISFDEKGYYNFEFNCIGTCLAAFGKGRKDRQFLPEELIHTIKFQAVINNYKEQQDIHWTLTVAIPSSVFQYHHLTSLSGETARGNFYKCGDRLPQPHYVTWSPVDTPEPDFHTPEYFGHLLFR